MSQDHGYNGWNNYPTWNVALWLDNSEGTYHGIREVVREALEARASVVDAIRGYVESLVIAEGFGALLDGSSFVVDIYGWAMDHVDYHELADTYVAEVAEDA